MKKKLLALLLCGVLAISCFAGCRTDEGSKKTDGEKKTEQQQEDKVTVESLMEKVNEKSADIKSVKATMTMEIAMSMAMMGESMDMSVSAEGDIESTETVSYSKMDMTTEMLGESAEETTESYTVIEDGKSIVYSGALGEWYKVETEVDSEAVSGLNDSLGTYESMLDAGISFTLSEDTVKVNEKDAYKLTAEIAADKFMGAMGEDETLSETLDGYDFTGKKFAVTMCIYKDTYFPAEVVVELLADSEAETETPDPESEELTMDFTAFKVSVVYNSYNDIDSLEVPEDVISAAIDMSDLGEGIDLSDVE